MSESTLEVSLKPLYDWVEDIYSGNKSKIYNAMSIMPQILEKSPKELLVKDRFVDILSGNLIRNS